MREVFGIVGRESYDFFEDAVLEISVDIFGAGGIGPTIIAEKSNIDKCGESEFDDGVNGAGEIRERDIIDNFGGEIRDEKDTESAEDGGEEGMENEIGWEVGEFKEFFEKAVISKHFYPPRGGSFGDGDRCGCA